MKLVIFRDSSIGRLRMERSHPLGTWSITLPPSSMTTDGPILCSGSRDQCIAMIERQYTNHQSQIGNLRSTVPTGEAK